MKKLLLLLTCGLLAAATLAALAYHQLRWDPGLEARQHSPAGLLALGGRDIPEGSLPADFLQSPAVTDALTRARAGEADIPWSRTHQAWLEAMRTRFETPHYWRESEALALASFAARFYGDPRLETDTLRSDLLEIELRTDLVLLDIAPRGARLAELAADTDAPPAVWSHLLDIAQTRTDLKLGPLLDRTSVEGAFVSGFVEANRMEPEWTSEDLLEKARARRALNQAWRDFEAGLPYPQEALPGPQQLARAENAPGGGLDWSAMTWRQNRSRHELMAAIIVMALQKQRAGSQPLFADNLPPEIADLTRAYSDWLSLQDDPVEVQVKLKGPRGLATAGAPGGGRRRPSWPGGPQPQHAAERVGIR